MSENSYDHLTRHLSLVPAHRALGRAMEARIYQGLALQRPILDVGCGDGYFAQAALPQPIDAGIDPSPAALAECAQLGIYTELRQASGDALPFPDAAFATVVSNCVLEHIQQIDQTIQEIGRVLRPGGTFVGTMVTDQLAGLLGIPRMLRSLGLPDIAEVYSTWFNRKAQHYNMLPLSEWSAKLAKAGLRVNHSQYYLGPTATLVFDFLHYYALPSAVIHMFLHRWLLWPSPRNVALIAGLLRGVYNEGMLACGSCVFVIAKKEV